MSWRDGSKPKYGRWRKFRLTILDRDGWRCQTCGKYGNEVDHINGHGGGMFNPANCQTLCRGCHVLKSRIERGYRPDPEHEAWQCYLTDTI